MIEVTPGMKNLPFNGFWAASDFRPFVPNRTKRLSCRWVPMEKSKSSVGGEGHPVGLAALGCFALCLSVLKTYQFRCIQRVLDVTAKTDL